MSKANGLCPEYLRVGEAINDQDGYAYLERPGMQLVRHQLPNIQKHLAPHRFLFYGPAGIGKRISMAGCVEAAYESKNFIIFFIPNALDLRFIRNWGRYRDGRGLGWGNEDSKDWSPPKRNLRDPERIDIGMSGLALLRNFRIHNQHTGILDSITATKDYRFTDTISTKKGATLGELIKFGEQNRGEFSNDIFGIIVSEVLRLNDNRLSVMVAINSVHNIYQRKTNIHYIKMKDEPIDDYDPLKNVYELNLIRHVKKLVKGNWKNGIIVTSVRKQDQLKGYSRTGQSGNSRPERRRHGLHHEWQQGGGPAAGKQRVAKGVAVTGSDHPGDLLGSRGFKAMDPHIPLMEGDYTASQVDTMMQYYERAGYLNFKGMLPADSQNSEFLESDLENVQKEFRQVVDRNPGQLLHCAAFY